jgi:hypothetical protein
MGSNLPPDDDPPEVACTVPPDYEPDPDTLKLLAAQPFDAGGDA